MDIKIPETLDAWNAAGADYLPGLLGMRFRKVEADEVVATLEVSRALFPALKWNRDRCSELQQAIPSSEVDARDQSATPHSD